MKPGILAGILAAVVTWSPEARTETGLGFYGMVTTLRRDHVVEVRVHGLDGWGISTSYWARVTMGTESLSLGEAMFRGLSEDGTAAREVVWYVESLETHGTVRMVFCRPRACTRPIDGEFYVD
jgi:hypothetical protein